MTRFSTRSATATLSATVLLLTAAFAGGAQASDRRPDRSDRPVQIRVGRPVTMSDGLIAPPVTPAIVGANARWAEDELGAWDGVNDRPAPGLVDAAKSAKLDLVRYPGGTIANMFDFTDAIGPDDRRGCQTSGGFAAPTFASLTPEQNRFGPDEQQEFVRSFGGETMIMVPSINQTAQDAANFVEYMNSPADGTRSNPNGGEDWAERRAENGHRAPYNIRYWEYGNEPYLPGQRYWRALDAQTRAKEFVEGGWERQTAQSDFYQNDDGLFTGCDLLNRQAGTGEAGQSFRTRYRPIALPADSTTASGPIAEPTLTVNGSVWTRTDDLAASGPAETVYRVDQTAGTVTFGDGVHGVVPPKDARLSVEYTTGRQDGFLDFQRAMKSIDPRIEVCAGYAKQEFIDAMGDRPYDCLGVHSYTFPTAGDTQGAFSTTELYDNLMRSSAEPTAELADLRTELAGYFPDSGSRPELLVTEYGTINGQSPPGVRFPSNYSAMLMHNLYTASLQIGQINNGVRASINSNLNNRPAANPGARDWGQLLATPPGFLFTGRAQSLSLAESMVGQIPRQVRLSENPAPSGKDYPSLVAAATCDGGTQRMLVVNRDPISPVPFSVTEPTSARARITTVTAQDVTAFNTDVLAPIQATLTTIRPSRGQITSTLPAHSANLIEITSLPGTRGC